MQEPFYSDVPVCPFMIFKTFIMMMMMMMIIIIIIIIIIISIHIISCMSFSVYCMLFP